MDNDNRVEVGDTAAEQGDASEFQGQIVVLALKQEDECQAFAELFANMKLEVKHAATAKEALNLLEDNSVSLLVIDIQLSDIHAWQMIGKIREIERSRDVPVIIITDQPTLGTTVAGVDYLMRPVSIARLRHNVIATLTV
jgi:DNA-binding response OmpR family regulator